MIEMRVARRPGEHRARDAKIIMLSRRAVIDDAALAELGLKPHQLIKGAFAHGPSTILSSPGRLGGEEVEGDVRAPWPSAAHCAGRVSSSSAPTSRVELQG